MMTFSDITAYIFQKSNSELVKKTAYSLSSIFLLIAPLFIIIDLLDGELFTAGMVSILFFAGCINVWIFRKKDTYYPAVTLLLLLPIYLVFNYHLIHTEEMIGIIWTFPFLVGFYFALPEKLGWIANICCILVTAAASFDVFSTGIAIRITVSETIVSLFIATLVNMLNRQNQELAQQANLDSLTGLLNRKTLENTLNQAILARQTQQQPASILCIDLDHFKRINDRYGHHTGDTVLSATAQLLTTQFTKDAKLYRLGGEEFLAFLPNTTAAEALAKAERLRQCIAETNMTIDNTTTLNVTASIGVSEYQPPNTWEQWIHKADANMYQAKNNGRNSVVI